MGEQFLDFGEVFFVRSDGELATGGVGSCGEDKDGNLIFYEILGQTGIDGIPYLNIEGKQKFRRIIIRRVYPYIKEQEEEL